MSNHIFWLSSYPKSGNTLLRSILISLFFTNDGRFKIDKFKDIKQFDVTKLISKNEYLLKKDLKNVEILYKYILDLQTRNSLDIKKNSFIFLKTHSGLFKVSNYPFTIEDNTLGIFYIIRDPRDICISWSIHAGMSIDDSINFMLNENSLLHWKENDDTDELFSDHTRPRLYLSSWDRHVNSWTKVNWKKPKKIIRFEDIVYKKKETVLEIIKFFEKNYNININNKEEKIMNIVETTDFKILKNQELKKGFSESTKFSNFFSKGKKNQWKELLKKNQIKKLEDKFGNVMKQYKYNIFLKNEN